MTDQDGTDAGRVYERGKVITQGLSERYGVTPFFFWQPMAYVTGPIEQAVAELSDSTIDISGLLLDHQDVFIDGGHTNEEGARLVAEESGPTSPPPSTTGTDPLMDDVTSSRTAGRPSGAGTRVAMRSRHSLRLARDVSRFASAQRALVARPRDDRRRPVRAGPDHDHDRAPGRRLHPLLMPAQRGDDQALLAPGGAGELVDQLVAQPQRRTEPQAQLAVEEGLVVGPEALTGLQPDQQLVDRVLDDLGPAQVGHPLEGQAHGRGADGRPLRRAHHVVEAALDAARAGAGPDRSRDGPSGGGSATSPVR